MAASTRKEQVIMLAQCTYKAGTVIIRTIFPGKVVQIDGLIISRS